MDEVPNVPTRPATDSYSTSLSHSVSAELSQFADDPRVPKIPRLTTGPALARVLVVDDDADMRAYVTDCLSDAFDVVATASLERALTIARWMLPDVIVCDLVLPGGSGLALRAALADDDRLADVPILHVSGEVEPPTSIAHFLAKPFTRATLRAALLRALQQQD